MSMRYYGVDDVGLILSSSHIQMLAERICKDYSIQAWEDDRYELIDEVVDMLCLESISEFSGEALGINDDGTAVWDDCEHYWHDEIYYVGASRTASLCKAAYSDMNELCEEFKERIGKHMPENFDYRSNIKKIAGTYFG